MICLFVFFYCSLRCFSLARTGIINYHYGNASFTAERVNVTRPAILKNGRKLAPVPTPDGKLDVRFLSLSWTCLFFWSM